MVKKKRKNKNAENGGTMPAGAVLEMNDSAFNDFLQANKEKIDSVTPHNPSIAKDDEWRLETV